MVEYVSYAHRRVTKTLTESPPSAYTVPIHDIQQCINSRGWEECVTSNFPESPHVLVNRQCSITICMYNGWNRCSEGSPSQDILERAV